MVDTPHRFKHESVGLAAINGNSVILECIDVFRDGWAAKRIALEILPGCDFPLSMEALNLLVKDRRLTFNNGKRYLLLELTHFSILPYI